MTSNDNHLPGVLPLVFRTIPQMSTDTEPPTSVDHAHTTAISTFPTELLETIASKVDANDLGNLRLVCKTFCGATTELFGRTHLTHRRFIFSPESMKGLVELTAHTVFRNCIQSISFGTHRIETDVRVLMYALYKEGLNNERTLAMLRKYVKSADVQVEFIKAFQGHISGLCQVFRNLQQAGRDRQVVLGIFDETMDVWSDLQESEQPHRPARPRAVFRSAYRSSDLYHDLVPFRQWSLQSIETFDAIVTAMDQVNFTPKSFDFDLRTHQDHALDSRLRTALLSDSGAFNPAYNLCFKLALEVELYIKTASRGLEIRRMPTTKNEVCLKDIPRFSEETFFQCVQEVLRAPFFHDLQVTSCIVDLDFFCEFLEKQKDTLRKVDMRNVVLEVGEDDSWDPVTPCMRLFRILESMPYLEDVSFKRIGYQESYSETKGTLVDTIESWKGISEVHSGIADFITSWEWKNHPDNHDFKHDSEIWEQSWEEDAFKVVYLECPKSIERVMKSAKV